MLDLTCKSDGLLLSTDIAHPTSVSTRRHQGKLRRYDPNQIIFHEGDEAMRLFQVIDGAIALYCMVEKDREAIIEIVGHGAIIGLNRNGCYFYSARALNDVCLIATTGQKQQQRKLAATSSVHQLINRINRLYQSHAMVRTSMAIRRVAQFIVLSAKANTISNKTPETFTLHLNRTEVSDFLALSLETVSRAFSELRRRQIIAYENANEVKITNHKELLTIAGNSVSPFGRPDDDI